MRGETIGDVKGGGSSAGAQIDDLEEKKNRVLGWFRFDTLPLGPNGSSLDGRVRAIWTNQREGFGMSGDV